MFAVSPAGGKNGLAVEVDACDFHRPPRIGGQGLGKPRSVGVNGIVLLRAPVEGSEVTTSGS